MEAVEPPDGRPAGAGRLPLLLLHGGGPGVDADSNWRPVRARLDRSFACVAPDLLGFGSRVVAPDGAGLPRGPRAWARARARQVVELMDAQGLDRVTLVGNSAAGGAAALALLADAPDRVSKAVLMGGAGTGGLPAAVPFYADPSRESMRRTLANLVADPRQHEALIDELTDLRLAQALRPGAETAFRAMFEPDHDARAIDLTAIACPVLALHGELDRVAPAAVSARLADAIPRARVEVVPGAGHWIHVDRPDEFCHLVEEFLRA